MKTPLSVRSLFTLSRPIGRAVCRAGTLRAALRLLGRATQPVGPLSAVLAFTTLLALTPLPAAPTTLTFTANDNTNWNDGIAEDGNGGSTNISGITIEIFNISDTAGTFYNYRLVVGQAESSDGFHALTTYASTPNTTGWRGMRIRSSNGTAFQLNGFAYWNYGDTTPVGITVKGYRSGAEVASTSFTSSDIGGWQRSNVSLSSAFDAVDNVVFYSSGNTWHGINDVVIDDAVFPTPTVTSATYNGSTGVVAVTGTNFSATSGTANDVVANKFTFTGEGGSTRALTDTANVEIASATSFSLTLSTADKAAVNQLLNKNGTTSTGGTAYNLAAAAGFVAASASAADLTSNAITVSNAADTTAPTVSSIVRQSPTGQALTAGTATATFRVTFSEPVNTPASSNFAVLAVNSSSIAGTIASVTAVSSSIYDVAVTLSSGTGEFRLTVVD